MKVIIKNIELESNIPATPIYNSSYMVHIQFTPEHAQSLQASRGGQLDIDIENIAEEIKQEFIKYIKKIK